MRAPYLRHDTATRYRAGGRAFTLAELPPDSIRMDLDNTLAWLDVEHAPRWRPGDGKTYCNVYAHDVAEVLARGRAFIPRVWWRDPESVKPDTPVIYKTTVRELSANGLYRWFDRYGYAFGWYNCGTMEELRNRLEVSERKFVTDHESTLRVPVLGIGVIVYYNRRGGSGHISIALPATERHSHGDGVRQTQAGARNRQNFTDRWWSKLGSNVQFYYNEIPC